MLGELRRQPSRPRRQPKLTRRLVRMGLTPPRWTPWRMRAAPGRHRRGAFESDSPMKVSANEKWITRLAAGGFVRFWEGDYWWLARLRYPDELPKDASLERQQRASDNGWLTASRRSPTTRRAPSAAGPSPPAVRSARLLPADRRHARHECIGDIWKTRTPEPLLSRGFGSRLASPSCRALCGRVGVGRCRPI